MPVVSTIMALYGISPTEPLKHGSFVIVRGDSLKDYASTHLGYDETLIGFDDLGHWGADAFIIHAVDGHDRNLQTLAETSESEILYFISVLSCCYWIYFDLRHTIQLQHEAYHLRGSRRYTFKAGSRARHDRKEHLARGFTTLIRKPPIEVNDVAFGRVIEHPLFTPLFDLLSVDDRSDLQSRLLKATRSIYFAFSATTNESQLLRSIASIDTLLAPPPDEVRSIFKSVGQGEVSVKHHIRALLGETLLGNVIRFRETWRKVGAPPLYAYDQRNQVAHEGEMCDDGTVVDAYRLAVRVLLSIAQLATIFESRYHLVSELHSKFATAKLYGGALHLKACTHSGYPWLDRGMPDFLPFVISRYFRIQGDVEFEKRMQNIRSAVYVLVQQRDVAPEIAYQALQQVALASNCLPAKDEVIAGIDAAIDRHSAIRHAVFCRRGSQLAWVINDDATWNAAADTLWD